MYIRCAHIMTIMLCVLPTSVAKTVYVDADSKGKNDGTSWTDAFVSLRDAFSAASVGDEVWVARGAYRPTNKNDRSESFRVPDGVSLFGGFRGNESKRSDRDVGTFTTHLSGDIGIAGESRDNSLRVVVVSECTRGVEVDGFVISGAYNDQSEEQGRGGAMYVQNSILTIRNCTFLDNCALGGGALFNLNTTVHVITSKFVRNANCAVINYPSAITFDRCEFRQNTNFSDGAAVKSIRGSVCTYANCYFRGNKGAHDGGACFERGTSRFVNCLFVRNRATNACGALMVWGGDMTVDGCVFYQNKSEHWNGGLGTSTQGDLRVTNSIFWNNDGRYSAPERDQIWIENGGRVDYSCIQDWEGQLMGENNFAAEPKFVDVSRKNLRLAHDSPCIDAGTDDAVTEQYDLDGNPRILGGHVDIGAYENVCREVLDFTAEVRDDGQGGCDIAATVSVNPATLPPGSTVRVAFAPADGEPKIRKARIQPDGTGTATLRAAAGAWTVCVEGCAESLCRNVQCP